MLVLVIAPFFTSFLVRTLSWQLLLGDNGFLVETLKTLQLLGPDGHLLATPFAVVTGLTYNFLPFMVLPLYASLEKIDPRLVEAGHDLYASPFTAFRKITLPLSMPGLVAGTLLTFIPAAGDYINAELLGTPTHADDRQRDPGPVRRRRLPGRRRVVGDADGGDRGDGLPLRTTSRHRGARMSTTLAYRGRRWFSDHVVLIYAMLVLLYMFTPVFVVILMSFNEPAARQTYQFDGFTWNNWTNICAPFQLCDSVAVSLKIGLLATLVATLLGTLMAFAMVRHRFRGRSAANVFVFLPMASPEIVLGSSLLALFVNAGFAGVLGFWTIFVAHVMFCLSFVVVTVKARLSGLDPRLEQAAMDLYANEWQTFWRVTFPLVFPGILSAALLSFSLSFDDFIITNLNSGQTVTFPMFVWGAAQRGIPPQINVIGTIMFLVALALVLGGELGRRRRQIVR